jgi:hypothetical protein
MVCAAVTLVRASAYGQETSLPADSGFWSRWFERSDQAKDSQPHWVTPLVTTTPRLEQAYRFDVLWQQSAPGSPYTVNMGNSKGLELIPAPNTEIIVGVPPDIVHNNPAVRNGFGDLRLLVKYRLASAPEARGGCCIVTAFADLTLPTGSAPNGQPKPIVTSTLAYGKGFRAFDVQGTVSAAMLVDDVQSSAARTPGTTLFSTTSSGGCGRSAGTAYEFMQDSPAGQRLACSSRRTATGRICRP